MTTEEMEKVLQSMEDLPPRLKHQLQAHGVPVGPQTMKQEWPGQIIGLPRPEPLKPHQKFVLARQFLESEIKALIAEGKQTSPELVAAKAALATVKTTIGFQRVSEMPTEGGAEEAA